MLEVPFHPPEKLALGRTRESEGAAEPKVGEDADETELPTATVLVVAAVVAVLAVLETSPSELSDVVSWVLERS